MAVKWDEVVRDEKYQLLDEDQKSVVRQRYWDNVVSKDGGYQRLSDLEKIKVHERFFGQVHPNLLDRMFQETKDFLYNQPAEGAEVIKNAAVDALAPTEASIEQEAQRTGGTPYGKILGRTAAQTAAAFVPLTPVELAATIFGGKAINVGLAKGVPWLAETFPRLTAVLRAPIRKGMFAALDDVPKPAPAPKAPAAIPETPAAPAEQPLILESGAAPEPLPGGGPTPPPPPVEAPAGILGATPPVPEKDIFGQQLAKFNVSDDVKAIFAETSKAFKSQIDAARRGKIDFEGTAHLAEELGMTTEELIKRNAGQAYNSEQLEAAKGLLGRSGQEVRATLVAHRTAPTPETLIAVNRDVARHALVQESFYGARAEAGRALSILRKTTDPAVENMETVLQAIGGRELNEEMAKRLAAIDPTDVAALNTFVRDVVKVSKPEQVYEVWLNGILSNPLTHIKNFLGNTTFLVLKIPEKGVRGGLDRVWGMFSGERTAFAGEAPGEVYAAWQGIPDGVRRALYALEHGVIEGQTKLELERLPALSGKFGEMVRFPTRLLQAEDEFSKAIVGRMELSALAYRAAKQAGLKGAAFLQRVAELEAKPTPEMRAKIAEEVLLRTFQDKGGKIIEGLKKIREAPLVRYLLPFLQTPGNIAARAVERSPLGFIKVANSIIEKKGQEVIVDDLAKATLGSAISATVAIYALQGRITGSPPKDETQRDKFFRSGKIPYAVKLGNRWHSYAAFEPASMIVGATADTTLKAVEANKDPDVNVTGAIVSAIPRYLISRTFLAGLRDLLDGMADGERYGGALIERFAGSTVPMSSFMRFITYQLDPVIREPQNVADAVKANIPGLSKQVQPKLDVYGQEATRPGWQDGALTGILANIAIPSREERINPLDVEDSLSERKTGFPDRTMGGVKLHGDEYTKLLRLSGGLLKVAREQLQVVPGWKETPPQDKKTFLDNLTTAARKEGKLSIFDEVLDRTPDGEKRWALIEYGINTLGLDPDALLIRKPPK